MCALCMSAPGSESGSLLVCRVDSPRTRRYRLYLTLNDPPERVMRERWRGEDRGEGSRERKMRLTKDKQRTREEENERGSRLIELAQSTSGPCIY